MTEMVLTVKKIIKEFQLFFSTKVFGGEKLGG